MLSGIFIASLDSFPMNEDIIERSFAPKVLDMNRYNQAKNRKLGWGVIWMAIILVALASVSWFYFKGQQSDAVTEPETRVLPFPSASRAATAIDPMPVSESINRAATV